jgi:hypothetical protein
MGHAVKYWSGRGSPVRAIDSYGPLRVIFPGRCGWAVGDGPRPHVIVIAPELDC